MSFWQVESWSKQLANHVPKLAKFPPNLDHLCINDRYTTLRSVGSYGISLRGSAALRSCRSSRLRSLFLAGSAGRNCGHTKAQEVVPDLRMVPVLERRAAALGDIDPATATDNPAGVVRGPLVGTPLPDGIARHILQPEHCRSASRKDADSRRAPQARFEAVADAVFPVVPPGVFEPLCAAGCGFPLRLARQLALRPATKGICFSPRNHQRPVLDSARCNPDLASNLPR